MTDKLTIVINGLEYIAKTATHNITIEQKDIEINRLADALTHANNELVLASNEIKELAHDVGLLSIAEEENSIKIRDLEESLSEKDEEINGLQEYIAELEDEAGNMFSKFNELAQAINDIRSITKGLI